MMSKKQQPKGKSNKGGGDQSLLQPAAEVLQALILGDSFDEKFTPITHQVPRVSKRIES